ncbi:MAG: D-arginine dehydrogenase [Myxococcota bacterium]
MPSPAMIPWAQLRAASFGRLKTRVCHRAVSSEAPARADFVIVGAGFAGLATAAALVAQGARDIVVLEAEAIPGKHGSGRNAAMARRVIEDDVLARLATRSVALIGTMEQTRGELLARHGGLLIGDERAADTLLASASVIPALARDTLRLTRADAVAKVPALLGADFEAAVWSSRCGVADIHALLTRYIDRARAGGVRLLLRAPVQRVETDANGIAAVHTRQGRIATRTVVNAAGFGANPVAALAGLGPLPFDPVRRHLFVTTPTTLIAPDAPFVWNVTDGYYVRPEGAGLLMCACDETSWAPEDPPVDPTALGTLAAKFHRLVPGLRDAEPTRGWAGLRVMTPDGRFVIGPDPRLSGFFWVAGLGGHGMTTSAGVGEIAAQGILDGEVPAPYARAFAPERFLQ